MTAVLLAAAAGLAVIVVAQAKVIWRLRSRLRAERLASGTEALTWVGDSAREHLARKALQDGEGTP